MGENKRSLGESIEGNVDIFVKKNPIKGLSSKRGEKEEEKDLKFTILDKRNHVTMFMK